MTIQYDQLHAEIILGTTLKNKAYPEDNNMALHACEDVQQVLANRQNLAEALQLPLQQFVCAQQTHSDHFYQVTDKDLGRGATEQETAIPDTDALYTYAPNIVLCSFTADCVPVLFYDAQSKLIGAIHSGWQGTVKEITRKLFTHLQSKENCQMENIHVQIGRAISQEKFEVDEDVYRQFKQLSYADPYMYWEEATHKYHIDNQLVVKKQCELAGIPSEQISIDRTCTFASNDGFSYREDKKAGRHLSFIVRPQTES